MFSPAFDCGRSFGSDTAREWHRYPSYKHCDVVRTMSSQSQWPRAGSGCRTPTSWVAKGSLSPLLGKSRWRPVSMFCSTSAPCEMSEEQVSEALLTVPQLLRRYFTPVVAIALYASRRACAGIRPAFKAASAAVRMRCCCCRGPSSKKPCCRGMSLLERAAQHGCVFCTKCLLMGYGSQEPLRAALAISSSEVRALLQAHEAPSLEVATPQGRSVPTGSAGIPKVVHQVWIGPREVPEEWIDSWREQHRSAYPDWKHVLWRDDDVAGVLPSGLSDAYESLPHWCLKADIARYTILAKHGGVYMDADTAWLGRAGLDSVMDGRRVALAWENPPDEGFGLDERIGNSVIGVVPGHPLMLSLMDVISRDFRVLLDFLGERSPFLSDFRIGYRLTSPPAITRTYHSLGLDAADLLPSSTFYPIPWWRSQSLSKTLAETRAMFPTAVATHYGYSTNRMGGQTPDVASAAQSQAV
ncbi:unnamed protein product [Prorocentrum cordatum]|uniref:Uncharacterized protein n=1 Tax=Prorocentrum cordatum TaxID=2364126 RepID=A0ABN9Q6N5_9DINO|nr:unnamed protein product [Polarella glacialis]